MTTKEPEPPETLSAAIRMALADYRACLEDERYVIDMSVWHESNLDEDSSEVCHVCLAGAVIAKTLDTPHDKTLAPCDFPDRWEKTLLALDHARIGCVSLAVKNIRGLKSDDGFPGMDNVIEWEKDHTPVSSRDMAYLEETATFLEGVGL